MPQFDAADPALPRRRLAHRIRAVEWIVWSLTLAALVLGHGIQSFEAQLARELGVLAMLAMLVLGIGVVWRYRLTRDREDFRQQYGPVLAVQALWLAGLPIVALFGVPGFPESDHPLAAILAWSELMFWLRTLAGAIRLVRKIAADRRNPAFVFVASFALLISVGALLLMLPVSRVQPKNSAVEVGAPPLVALFTATSASCVTGLTVVDTGTYWSGTGQTIILGLFQLGGLGIMTFGAFFALGQRRGFLVRESAFFGQMLEADDRAALKRVLLAILLFTLTSELIGAVLLSTAAPAGPWHERAWFGTFHSISAFCNAGFSTLPRNLEGQGGRWQVWGVTAGLIVIGGFGFEVLRNLFAVLTWPIAKRWPWRNPDGMASPPRLTATARLAVVTSVVLLAAGAIAFFVLETDGVLARRPVSERIADSWFQSVAFRTAGFNTVDFTRLNPSTRLVGIVLMFIGASPGSTGGGIKTVVFGLMVLATAATIRGQERVEIAGRTVAESFVRRAAAVITLATCALLAAALLITIFEQRPDLFLDHLFEATSALGTVGFSTVTTSNLRPASQLVLIVTMFVGRVGPLTLLVGLARRQAGQNYEYPSERLALG